MTRRTLLAAVSAALVLLAGCVQLPQPVSGGPPAVEPAWTLREAQERRTEILTTVAAAARSGHVARALTVLDGPDRAITAAGYDLHRRFGEPVDTERWRAGSVTAVWSSTRTSYPRTAYVLVDLDDPKQKALLLEVYVRAGAARPWLRAASAYADPRARWPRNGAVVVPAPATVNGLDTRRVVQLVRALNRPDRASDARFTQNAVFRRNRELVAERERPKAIADVQATFTTTARAWSFAVDDGTVVIAPMRWSIVETYAKGWTFTFARRQTRKTLPGTYTALLDESAITYTIRVPSRGRVTLSNELIRPTWFTAYRHR